MAKRLQSQNEGHSSAVREDTLDFRYRVLLSFKIREHKRRLGSKIEAKSSTF